MRKFKLAHLLHPGTPLQLIYPIQSKCYGAVSFTHYTSPRCSQKLCHFEMRDCEVYKQFYRIFHTKLINMQTMFVKHQFQLYKLLVTKLSSYQIVKLSNCQVTKLSDYQIVRLPNCWFPNCWLPNYQVTKFLVTKLSSR